MRTANRLLFESPPPGKIRAVTWFSAAVLAGCLPASYYTLTGMTQMPASPELAPLGTRLAVAALIAVLGGGFFGGMLAYLGYYTTRLTLADDASQVHVETLRLFGRQVRTLPISRIASTSYHRGQLAFPGGVSVDAPWYWVRVQDERGFLLDAQGTFADRGALAKVLSNATRTDA